MIFAPVIRRSAYASAAPRAADLALQRFLMGAMATPRRRRFGRLHRHA